MDELETIKKELADKESLFFQAEDTIQACLDIQERITKKRWALESAKRTLADKIEALRDRILEIVTHS